MIYFTILLQMNFLHTVSLISYCSPGIDVTGVFLDISKAFDKVWLQGLIFILKCGVKAKYLDLMTNYLHEPMQIVVLNGQWSSRELIQSGAE